MSFVSRDAAARTREIIGISAAAALDEGLDVGKTVPVNPNGRRAAAAVQSKARIFMGKSVSIFSYFTAGVKTSRSHPSFSARALGRPSICAARTDNGIGSNRMSWILPL